MKERPILFSGQMVRAILADRKTQTRRIVKSDKYWCDLTNRPMDNDTGARTCVPWWNIGGKCDPLRHCPYGEVGDRLWVRETWREWPNPDGVKPGDDPCMYRTTSQVNSLWKWRPSVFMPRWASRITLEITGVRVERLQDITESDAEAEGAGTLDQIKLADLADSEQPCRCRFAWLWAKINGADSWSANPWVWVIEFRRIVDVA